MVKVPQRRRRDAAPQPVAGRWLSGGVAAAVAVAGSAVLWGTVGTQDSDALYESFRARVKAAAASDPRGRALAYLSQVQLPVAGAGALFDVARSARFDPAGPSAAGQLVTALIADGANAAARDDMGLTALHHALAHREFAVAQALLAGGADPAAAVPSGRLAGVTPLHYAVGQGMQDSVSTARWALGEATAAAGETALASAAADFPDVFAALPIGHRVPAAAAAAAAHGWAEKLARMLLSAKGGPKAVHSADALYSRQPLHLAALDGNAAVCRLLLNAGADAAATDRAGHTPAHLAALRGHTELSASLLRRKPSAAKMRDVVGRTPEQISLPTRPLAARLEAGPSDDGGWGGEEPPERVCDIPVVSGAMDAPQFFARFLSAGRPVMMKGGAADWKFRSLWARDKLRERHGALAVEVGRIPYASAFGNETRAVTLGEFLDGEGGGEWYVFHAGKGGQPSALERDVPVEAPFLSGLPKSLFRQTGRSSSVWQPQFYAGGTGTGAPPHWHADAWNALAHGAKRWWLYPPGRGEYSTLPVTEWMKSRPEGSFVCDQAAGDVLYVPAMWAHAVLNTRPSVGVAVEFRFARNVL